MDPNQIHEQDESFYQPLETSGFRLLRIRRADDDSIECELRTFTIKSVERLRYMPVSYVWGNRDEQELITVNGRPFKVLKSIFAVLELLCDRPELKVYHWFWIDSICINLRNNAERAAQVALMTHIYSGAVDCLVWLGEGNAQSDEGMEIMRRIAERDESENQHLLDDAESCRSFLNVAQRAWWRRAWTLQESIMTKAVDHHTYYYCGTRRLTGWNMICVAERVTRLMPNAAEFDESAVISMFHRRRIYHWFRYGQGGGATSLLALLAYSSFLEASDPRDYIYSLLGCVNAIDRELVGAARYDETVEQVYVDFARHWIEKRQSLDILSFAQIFQRTGGEHSLPSWVPDWRNRSKDRTLETGRLHPVPVLVSQSSKDHINGLRPWHLVPGPKEPVYEASLGRRPQINFSRDGFAMTCSAVFIDSIDGLSTLRDSASFPEGPPLETMEQSTSPVNAETVSLVGAASISSSVPDRQEDQGAPSVMLPVASSISEVRTEVALSLTFGRRDHCLQYHADWPHLILPLILMLGGHKSPIRDWRQASHFLSWYALNKGLRIRHHPLEAIFGDKDLPSVQDNAYRGLDDSLSNFYHATSSTERSSRLCVTAKGFVGMAPRYARKGDKVFVLMGCSVPVILRKHADETFEFVGEAYLHGFMEGQAVKAIHRTEEITLV